MNLHDLPNEPSLAELVQQGLRGPQGGWDDAEARDTAENPTYPVLFRITRNDTWAPMSTSAVRFWAYEAERP